MQVRSISSMFKTGLLYLVAAVIAALWFAPTIWMISTAFKVEGTILHYPPEWLPRVVTLTNFQLILANFPVLMWYRNDIIVATTTAALVLITGSLAGYAFARMRFRGKNAFFILFMCALLVPPEVTFVPTFLGIAAVGLGNTYPALFLPLIANSFALFLFREFFRRLPQELEDAARIDGCSRVGAFLRIAIPLSRPVIIAVAILSFMSSWNNFMWPLIISSTDDTKTLPVGMNQFAPMGGSSSVGYGLTMAGTAFVAIPAMLVFFILSRQFIRGVTYTGIKG